MRDSPWDYLDAVRRVLSEQPGYVATVIVGSLASGDFDQAHSDIDLIPLYDGPLAPAAKDDLTSRLRHRALPCPAHGLDLVAYSVREVQAPSPAPYLEFALSSGARWSDEVSFGEAYPGGLIDLAAARQFGTTLDGVAVPSLIGPVSAAGLLSELGRSLHWHLGRVHDPFHDPLGANAVLNACRALHCLQTGELVSKARGAQAYRHGAHGPLVERALATRLDLAAPTLPKHEVVAFVRAAAHEFERAGCGAQSAAILRRD